MRKHDASGNSDKPHDPILEQQRDHAEGEHGRGDLEVAVAPAGRTEPAGRGAELPGHRQQQQARKGEADATVLGILPARRNREQSDAHDQECPQAVVGVERLRDGPQQGHPERPQQIRWRVEGFGCPDQNEGLRRSAQDGRRREHEREGVAPPRGRHAPEPDRDHQDRERAGQAGESDECELVGPRQPAGGRCGGRDQRECRRHDPLNIGRIRQRLAARNGEQGRDAERRRQRLRQGQSRNGRGGPAGHERGAGDECRRVHLIGQEVRERRDQARHDVQIARRRPQQRREKSLLVLLHPEYDRVLGPELRRMQSVGRARKQQGHRDPEDRDDRERPPHAGFKPQMRPDAKRRGGLSASSSAPGPPSSPSAAPSGSTAACRFRARS